MATFRLRVNDRTRVVQVDDPDTPLLYVLRNDLDLPGTRFGCGLGQCGACTVHVDGTAVRACMTPLRAVQQKRVTTIEGFDKPDALARSRLVNCVGSKGKSRA
jgi:aerobic-type carbon monoxide dehydrogenase small subunit (CoxS/CutS family)